jgi:hypothetical protein
MNLRYIDCLIATEVMGWRLFGSVDGDLWIDKNKLGVMFKREWCPTINFLQAWQAVETLEYEEVQIKDMGKFGKRVRIVDKQCSPYFAWAETVPLGLCLAVLKVKGVKIEGDEE